MIHCINEVDAPQDDALVAQIVKSCVDAKGRDIVVLEMSKLSSVADFFIIVSGRSDRQVQGIANRIIDSMAESIQKPLSTDGLEKGQWAVIDFGSVLVHIFYDGVRKVYDLEGYWSGAPKTIATSSPDGEVIFRKAA
jgi:ribosome-associated protein